MTGCRDFSQSTLAREARKLYIFVGGPNPLSVALVILGINVAFVFVRKRLGKVDNDGPRTM